MSNSNNQINISYTRLRVHMHSKTLYILRQKKIKHKRKLSTFDVS